LAKINPEPITISPNPPGTRIVPGGFTIEQIWVNPPQSEPMILPKIILELDRSELYYWIKKSPNPEEPIQDKLQLASSTQATLIDRSFTLGESLIREPGWAVSFVLGGILIWREYSKWQLVKKLDKIDVVKIATSIGSAWQKAVLAFDAIEKSSTRSGALISATQELRENVKHLKSDVSGVKELSIETGEELSGQLHSLTEIARRLEAKIDDMGEDVDDIRKYK
jgi:hypothetical protein